MNKFKVIRTIDKWSKYTDEERRDIIYKLIGNDFIAQTMVQMYNISDPNNRINFILSGRASDDMIINSIINSVNNMNDYRIVPIAEKLSKINNKELHIDNPIVVYINDMFVKTNDVIFVSKYAIGDTNGNILWESDDILSDFKFYLLKYLQIRKESIVPALTIQDGPSKIIYINYLRNNELDDNIVPIISMPNIIIEVPESVMELEASYSKGMSYINTTELETKLIQLSSSDLFIGFITSVSAITEIKDTIVRYINDDDVYSSIENLAIIIYIYINIMHGLMKINTTSMTYIDWKNEKDVKNDYIMSYCVYLMKKIYENDYTILTSNKYKIENLVKYILNIYNSIMSHDIPESLKKDGYIFINAIDPIKLHGIFEYKVGKLQVQDIKPYYVQLRSFVYKNINHGEINYEKFPFITTERYNDNIDMIDDIKIHEYKEKIIYVIDKLGQHIQKIDKTGIINLGFLQDKFNTEGNGDISSYESIQQYLVNIVGIEWMTFHKAIKADNFIDNMLKFIVNIDTANEVNNFLNKKIEFINAMDVSQTSLQQEKINKQLQQQERINIYYNLTPEEKIEIDRFKFGSDEWNDQIEKRGQRIEIPTIVETEETTTDSMNLEDIDDEGWNESKFYEE